ERGQVLIDRARERDLGAVVRVRAHPNAVQLVRVLRVGHAPARAVAVAAHRGDLVAGERTTRLEVGLVVVVAVHILAGDTGAVGAEAARDRRAAADLTLAVELADLGGRDLRARGVGLLLEPEHGLPAVEHEPPLARGHRQRGADDVDVAERLVEVAIRGRDVLPARALVYGRDLDALGHVRGRVLVHGLPEPAVGEREAGARRGGRGHIVAREGEAERRVRERRRQGLGAYGGSGKREQGGAEVGRSDLGEASGEHSGSVLVETPGVGKQYRDEVLARKLAERARPARGLVE